MRTLQNQDTSRVSAGTNAAAPWTREQTRGYHLLARPRPSEEMSLRNEQIRDQPASCHRNTDGFEAEFPSFVRSKTSPVEALESHSKDSINANETLSIIDIDQEMKPSNQGRHNNAEVWSAESVRGKFERSTNVLSTESSATVRSKRPDLECTRVAAVVLCEHAQNLSEPEDGSGKAQPRAWVESSELPNESFESDESFESLSLANESGVSARQSDSLPGQNSAKDRQAEGGTDFCGEMGAEMNVNNHKIPCMSMKKKLDHDLLFLTEQNFCLSSQNELLRQNIREARQVSAEDCSKVLDAIIGYCQCQASQPASQSSRKRAASTVDQNRVAASCGGGGCGGYTPSGWNKRRGRQSLYGGGKEEGEEQVPRGECCCSPQSCCVCACSCCDVCPPKSAHPEVQNRKKKKRHASCGLTGSGKLVDENSSANSRRASTKLLGELAFQLERRILDYVFGLEGSKRRRFYGYTVNNIQQMMQKESKNSKGEDDQARRSDIESRYRKLMQGLKKVGYNIKVHGDFSQQMINHYGLLACSPDVDTIQEFGLQNAACINKLITQLARGEHEAAYFQTLLRGLQFLSKCDGGPLFVW